MKLCSRPKCSRVLKSDVSKEQGICGVCALTLPRIAKERHTGVSTLRVKRKAKHWGFDKI